MLSQALIEQGAPAARPGLLFLLSTAHAHHRLRECSLTDLDRRIPAPVCGPHVPCYVGYFHLLFFVYEEPINVLLREKLQIEDFSNSRNMNRQFVSRSHAPEPCRFVSMPRMRSPYEVSPGKTRFNVKYGALCAAKWASRRRIDGPLGAGNGKMAIAPQSPAIRPPPRVLRSPTKYGLSTLAKILPSAAVSSAEFAKQALQIVDEIQRRKVRGDEIDSGRIVRHLGREEIADKSRCAA